MKIVKALTLGLKKVYIIYSQKRLAFEFDKQKSRSNYQKHGIDFVKAQKLWHDENAIEDEADTIEEKRYRRTGEIDGISYTAYFTWRNDKVRLISVRRARKNEVDEYDKNKC